MACATTWMLPRSDIENMCMLSCVAIPNAALWCVIAYTNQRRSFPEKCFLAPLLFLYGCWRLCSICHINRHVFFHNSINFSSNSSLQNFIFRQTRQNTSYMTPWPTNWVNWVTTFRTDRWQLFTLWMCRQLDVELSCVAINAPWVTCRDMIPWSKLC